MSSQTGAVEPIRWQLRRLFRPARRAVMSQLYRDDNGQIEDAILVAGTARSGTTWLGDILAGKDGRLLFEPFHSEKIAALQNLPYFPYLRPHEKNPQLSAYCQQLFSGAVRHPWIDRELTNLRPSFRVVKEIRANLFLKWLNVNFPQVPSLLLMRHPCAVVLSRLQLQWATDSDIHSFLAQEQLVADYLRPYLKLIEGAQTEEEKHAIIWCIHYLVPLQQFAAGELNLVYYEDLCLQPAQALARIEQVVGRPFAAPALPSLARPSATTTPHAGVAIRGEERVRWWQQVLAPAQIERILGIVAAFGLDYLYGEHPRPAMGFSREKYRDFA